MSSIVASQSTLPKLPIDVISHLCLTLSSLADTVTLTRLARASLDLHDAAIPALYRQITLTKRTILTFMVPSYSHTISEKSPWTYTTHLRVSSLPADLTDWPSPTCPSTAPLFPNVHTIALDDEAIWQLIVHSHANTTPHPLITFLTTHTSPKHLTINYPDAQRTAHSFGGGYCCCFAAVRAFQQNPLRAAAFDRSSTARFISCLANQWQLDSLTVRGVVDDQPPRDVIVKRMEVEWAACQCADEHFHGEWCFNHVSPLKRVEQVRELLSWGAEHETMISMSGVQRVGGWCDIQDVGKWIDERLAEGSKGAETCCNLSPSKV